MKKIYRHSNATFLFFLSALLLCLGSCQSSDNTEAVEGATVASLPLKAQMGEASSRVGMTDIYGGAFSCYWNSDKLNIYHQYVLDGTIQSMAPLEFVTTATSGTLATFSYVGPSAHRYNPGARLYAFSSNTNGYYEEDYAFLYVADDGTSTLRVHTLANMGDDDLTSGPQKGTLDDCAKCDVLYGSTTVNPETGLPESLTMHHLFGMLHLRLTNSNFSTSYPVTVTFNTPSANILPGNNGRAIFEKDGSTFSMTGSWNKIWQATVTPTTNGIVDVYMMTWPFSSANGTLMVYCMDTSANSYISRSVVLSDFSLAAAQLKSKPLAISSTTAVSSTSYSKLYAWDATDFQPVTVGTAPTNVNTNTMPMISWFNYPANAFYACNSCPSGNELTWYLSVPCYWDSGSISGGNTTSYTMADGNTTKAGMWFRKKSGIPNYSAAIRYGIIGYVWSTFEPLTLTADLATSLNLSNDYFFLPACGWTDSDGNIMGCGIQGSYWSSSDYSSSAIGFTFTSNRVDLDDNFSRTFGFCLWQAQ